jgi:hypothetical protein
VVAAGASCGRGLASATVEMTPCDVVVEDVPVGAPAGLGDADVLRLT